MTIVKKTSPGSPTRPGGPIYVVITQKDAVKLRDRWPNAAPEPLVAVLDLVWEDGGDRIAAALDAVVTPVEGL